MNPSIKLVVTILLIAGTIVGALGAGKLPSADPLITGAGLVLIVIGGVIAWIQRRKDAALPAGSAGSVDVRALIRELPAKLQPIADDADRITLAQLADRIGELDADYFRPIADSAPLLLGPMGTERFASVFGIYASGERLISRAWSAAVDQHRPEAVSSLREGIVRIQEAAVAIDAQGARAA